MMRSIVIVALFASSITFASEKTVENAKRFSREVCAPLSVSYDRERGVNRCLKDFLNQKCFKTEFVKKNKKMILDWCNFSFEMAKTGTIENCAGYLANQMDIKRARLFE